MDEGKEVDFKGGDGPYEHRPLHGILECLWGRMTRPEHANTEKDFSLNNFFIIGTIERNKQHTAIINK